MEMETWQIGDVFWKLKQKDFLKDFIGKSSILWKESGVSLVQNPQDNKLEMCWPIAVWVINGKQPNKKSDLNHTDSLMGRVPFPWKMHTYAYKNVGVQFQVSSGFLKTLHGLPPNPQWTKRVICLWIQYLKIYELETDSDSPYSRNPELEEWTMASFLSVRFIHNQSPAYVLQGQEFHASPSGGPVVLCHD